eukprot:15104604-Alexandrium_andersonii.AAC.1
MPNPTACKSWNRLSRSSPCSLGSMPSACLEAARAQATCPASAPPPWALDAPGPSADMTPIPVEGELATR